jgi:hypothetical protein
MSTTPVSPKEPSSSTDPLPTPLPPPVVIPGDKKRHTEPESGANNDGRFKKLRIDCSQTPAISCSEDFTKKPNAFLDGPGHDDQDQEEESLSILPQNEGLSSYFGKNDYVRESKYIPIHYNQRKAELKAVMKPMSPLERYHFACREKVSVRKVMSNMVPNVDKYIDQVLKSGKLYDDLPIPDGHVDIHKYIDKISRSMWEMDNDEASLKQAFEVKDMETVRGLRENLVCEMNDLRKKQTSIVFDPSCLEHPPFPRKSYEDYEDLLKYKDFHMRDLILVHVFLDGQIRLDGAISHGINMKNRHIHDE